MTAPVALFTLCTIAVVLTAGWSKSRVITGLMAAGILVFAFAMRSGTFTLVIVGGAAFGGFLGLKLFYERNDVKNLNGWQRLWLVSTIIVITVATFAAYQHEDNTPKVVVQWLIISAISYVIGLGVAWIRRGFKRDGI